MKAEAAPLLIKITNARTAERVGTNQFRTLHTVNTKNMWYHPKYYEEMKRKRKELERQASSTKQEGESKDEHQASSDKQQASEQQAD